MILYVFIWLKCLLLKEDYKLKTVRVDESKGEDLRVEGIVGFSQKAVVILGISGDQKVLCRILGGSL